MNKKKLGIKIQIDSDLQTLKWIFFNLLRELSPFLLLELTFILD